MTNREDALEQRLLLLGQQELQLEVRMKQLRERARTSGKFDPPPDWYSFISRLRSGYGPRWTVVQTRSV